MFQDDADRMGVQTKMQQTAADQLTANLRTLENKVGQPDRFAMGLSSLPGPPGCGQPDFPYDQGPFRGGHMAWRAGLGGQGKASQRSRQPAAWALFWEGLRWWTQSQR